MTILLPYRVKSITTRKMAQSHTSVCHYGTLMYSMLHNIYCMAEDYTSTRVNMAYSSIQTIYWCQLGTNAHGRDGLYRHHV